VNPILTRRIRISTTPLMTRSKGQAIGFFHHSDIDSEISDRPTFITRPVTMPKLFSAKKAASHVLSMFRRNRSLKSELAVEDVYVPTRSVTALALLRPNSLAIRIAYRSINVSRERRNGTMVSYMTYMQPIWIILLSFMDR
jgi:hypothetical protein